MQFRTISLSAAALGAGSLFASPVGAQTLTVSVQVPQLKVAEYHKPYTAVWLEKDGAVVATLDVRYDVDNPKGEGTKWLADLRTFWRKAGRSMKFPANGITGPTRGPGAYKTAWPAGKGALPKLAPGNYVLVVEAAREVGGREALRLPFAWSGSGSATANAQGASELGAVSLTLR